MHILTALFLAAVVLATRRLQLDPCSPDVYLLGQGAPTRHHGYTFGPEGMLPGVNATIDSLGRGRLQLAVMPPCLAAKAIPIKFLGPGGLKEAIAWLRKQCRAKDCVVFSGLPKIVTSGIRGINVRPV